MLDREHGDDPETATLRPSRVSGSSVAVDPYPDLASRLESGALNIAAMSEEVKQFGEAEAAPYTSLDVAAR
jgi:hypothetical protein